MFFRRLSEVRIRLGHCDGRREGPALSNVGEGPHEEDHYLGDSSTSILLLRECCTFCLLFISIYVCTVCISILVHW